MNPESATLRSTDLCALLGVTDRSIHRWLAVPGYPIHHFFLTTPHAGVAMRCRKSSHDYVRNVGAASHAMTCGAL